MQRWGAVMNHNHLAVFCNKLAGLQKALGLIHIPADAHVVHGDLLNVLLGVDDVQTAQRNACILLWTRFGLLFSREGDLIK
jgi:hypothetical protein